MNRRKDYRRRIHTDASRLSSEFDSRLADVWLFLFGSHEALLEQGAEEIGWFLRMAYLRGYEDALTEPRRGDLYRRLGLPAPPPRTEKRAASLSKRGASR
jgi:hypothetical protein